MNPAIENAEGKFWRRLKYELITSFSRFLSSMANAFLAPETCLPASILERAKAQMENPPAAPRLSILPAELPYPLMHKPLCFCRKSLEITFYAGPAPPPIGMLKVLAILRNSI